MDPLSLNKYTYAHNNPIMYMDTNGHWISTALGGLLGASWGALDAYNSGKSVWGGAVSGGISGAISGLAVDLTGGLALLPTLGITGGVGILAGMGGDALNRISNGERLDWSTALKAGIINGIANMTAGSLNRLFGIVAKDAAPKAIEGTWHMIKSNAVTMSSKSEFLRQIVTGEISTKIIFALETLFEGWIINILASQGE